MTLTIKTEMLRVLYSVTGKISNLFFLLLCHMRIAEHCDIHSVNKHICFIFKEIFKVSESFEFMMV